MELVEMKNVYLKGVLCLYVHR